MDYGVNSKEVIGALQTVFQSGDVFEIRVLDAITKAYKRPHIESGYFDYDHIEDVPKQLEHIQYAKGIYFTVNPVNPDLLARAYNRVRACGKDPVTSDNDILCRRWLLIDCDAKRVSGVSSTKEEHNYALAKAQEIKAGFNSIGWANPIEIDSGNGSQLMYRVELPKDDENLIHNVLKSLSVVSDEHVDVDITVHNPARIWRLPGTWNCKGDHTEDRPYRMSKIIAKPSQLLVVTKEQLESVIVPEEDTTEKATTQFSANCYQQESTFNLDEWISKYLPNLDDPIVWHCGRKWVMKVCPFNDSHTDKSACLIEHPNGAISFTCHHNSCQGNDWKKLRELFEPGCYDKKEESYPEIDLTSFLDSFQKKKQAKENPFEHPGDLTDDILNIPGLVSDIVDLSLKTAPYPNKTLATCSAISFVAHIAGRKFRDCRNNFTNLYLIALANSGTGKDHPRKVNIELANQVGLGGSIGDAFASGAGLEDFMYLSPASLFQIDEVDWLFNVMKNSGKDSTMAESINEKLLKFYGESNSTYYMRKKAVSMEKENNVIQGMIHNPCLNLYGTAVPSYFYESMSKRVLENGLIARCIVFESDKRGRGGNSQIIEKHVTESLVNKIKAITTIDNQPSLLGKPQSIIEIPETEDAAELILQYRHKCDDNYSMFESIREYTAMALWARVMEKVYKLSMIYAISENPQSPIITVTGVKWAFAFVEYATKLLLYRAGQYCYESETDKKLKRIVTLLQERSNEQLGKRDIYRKVGISAREFDDLERTLLESERVAKLFDNGKSYYVALS